MGSGCRAHCTGNFGIVYPRWRECEAVETEDRRKCGVEPSQLARTSDDKRMRKGQPNLASESAQQKLREITSMAAVPRSQESKC